jgi:hypothetical protein
VLSVDLAEPLYHTLLLSGKNRIPLSCGAHTLELYRRLPYGWRTSPEDVSSDLYMWQQILAMPGCRGASATRPTLLHFPTSGRPGWTSDERLAELERYAARLGDPLLQKELMERILDVVIPNWTRFKIRKKWQGRLRRYENGQQPDASDD